MSCLLVLPSDLAWVSHPRLAAFGLLAEGHLVSCWLCETKIRTNSHDTNIQAKIEISPAHVAGLQQAGAVVHFELSRPAAPFTGFQVISSWTLFSTGLNKLYIVGRGPRAGMQSEREAALFPGPLLHP